MAKYFDVVDNNKKGILSQIIREEFFEKVEMQDIEFHFRHNHAHYDQLKYIIRDSELKQRIDACLQERLEILKDRQEKEQK